jgi:hypothetical protein
MLNLKLLILAPSLDEIRDYLFGALEEAELDCVPPGTKVLFAEWAEPDRDELTWGNLLIDWRTQGFPCGSMLWFHSGHRAVLLREGVEHYLVTFDNEESYLLGLEKIQAYISVRR